MEESSRWKARVLIVDDNEHVRKMLKQLLQRHGYQITTAESGDGAIESLQSTADNVDLVLTDYVMQKGNGIELLKKIRKANMFLPVIIMTGFGQKELVIEALQNRCDGYIEKPVDANTLIAEIERVLTLAEDIRKNYQFMTTTYDGTIQGISMPTFLQAVETEEKTWTLKVDSHGKVGHLYFREGELIEAETAGLKGEDAALEIIVWENAKIMIHNTCDKERSIESSLNFIIFESYRIKDEQTSKAPPDDGLLKKAIRLIHGHHSKEAQGVLKTFLEINPESHEGWLWHSRLLSSIKSAEISLRKAEKIAPADPEVKQELEKFSLAKQKLSQDKIRRCRFCWSPIQENVFQCQYCKAHLSIHKDFFVSRRVPLKEVLQAAIERYADVVSREKSISAHYYLAIAHLNLEHWDEALNQLHKAVNLSPKNPYLSGQLRSLIDHMDSWSLLSQEGTSSYGETTEQPPGDSLVFKRERILVVEDSVTTRKVISITLSQKGFEVIEAGDGLEALSKVRDAKPDLILLDIILPKMDGYGVLSIMKSNPETKHIPVIMLTSKDAYAYKVKGELAGSTAYLTKPFDPEQLVETIEKTLLRFQTSTAH